MIEKYIISDIKQLYIINKWGKILLVRFLRKLVKKLREVSLVVPYTRTQRKWTCFVHFQMKSLSLKTIRTNDPLLKRERSSYLVCKASLYLPFNRSFRWDSISETLSRNSKYYREKLGCFPIRCTVYEHQGLEHDYWGEQDFKNFNSVVLSLHWTITVRNFELT